jgi:diaminohydroxyphosphoribosylaminopyrimidine deaminase/5-amino-6-(5-phosphoribosylamino)uracil reductase
MIVEGGKFTLDRFIESGLWDEARVFSSAIELGSGLGVPSFIAKPDFTENIDGDDLKIYYNETPR